MSAGHNCDSPELDMLPFDHEIVKKSVSLGDFCWIGTSSIILPGVHIGKYSVIGAGCVLTKNTEDYSIYAGNPGKLIGYRKNKDLGKITKSWPSTKKGSIYIIA